MRELPTARRQALVIEELPEEVLVYDMITEKAHCLNRTAALIWKHCDGQKGPGEIARLLEQELSSPVSEEVVTLGLEELAVYELLKEATPRGPQKTRLGRRQLIKKLGLTAAIGLPLIVSITAPTAAQAATIDPCAPATGRPEGCPCTDDSECASFNCNGGTCGPALKPSRKP